MVQIFVVFTDRLTTVKIRTTKILMNTCRCGLSVALARNLEPRNFLLKALVATPRNFAPTKISRYTVKAVYILLIVCSTNQVHFGIKISSTQHESALYILGTSTMGCIVLVLQPSRRPMTRR